MDQITSGMKKIKINLVTQSQKEARERAQLETQRSSADSVAQNLFPEQAGKNPRVLAATPEEQAITFDSSAAPTRDAQSPRSGTSISALPLQQGSANVPVTPVQKTTSSMAATTPRQASSSPVAPDPDLASHSEGLDFFIPYQPEGPEPVPMSQQEPLQWLPPNAPPSYSNTPAATPSPARKNNLFYYTPGGIAFAPRGTQRMPRPELRLAGTDEDEEQDEEEIRMALSLDTPDTPSQ